MDFLYCYAKVIILDLQEAKMPQASKSEKSFSVRMKAWFRTGKAGLLRSEVTTS
jgi:hypothetical protein